MIPLEVERPVRPAIFTLIVYVTIHMYICIIIGDGPFLMGLSVIMHPRPSQDGQMFYTKVLPKEGLPPCLSSMPPLLSRDTRYLLTPGHSPQIGQDRSRDLNTDLPTDHVIMIMV